MIFAFSRVSPATSRMVKSVNIQHAPDHSIRARRLMKEYKEIQKVHNSKKDPVFTVSQHYVDITELLILLCYIMNVAATGGTYKRQLI